MKKWFTDKTKFWKVMKICATQTVIAMILFGFSMAHESDGQVLETKITIQLEDVSLETALREIGRISKVQFVYSEDQLDLDEKVTIDVSEQSLGEVLDRLLSPYRIKYKVHEKELTVTLKKQSGEPKLKRTPLSVTGQVLDAGTNQPLAGVNVIIKGTITGTTTDVDGKFSIQANEDDFLVFSFIGFLPYETRVGSRSVIDVLLKEDTKKLDEVIVNAGYWTVKEKEQTGNIARITADDIKNQPVSNPLQAMAGRMTGVMITQETGVAGGGIQVQIRGKNSINNGNDPLYIIDGIPVLSTSLKSVYFGSSLGVGNPFSTINPSDIESIEVLKDGAATAVYGSRGANGVILITTKRGAVGKTKLDVNFSTGVSQVTNMMNVMKTPDYVSMRKEAFKNDNATPTPTGAYDLLLWDTTRYTNWQKELIGNTGHITNLNASLSGGDKNTQFLISAGYYKETMVFPGDFGFKRGSGSFSLRHKSNDQKFQILLSVNYQAEDNQLSSGDFTSQSLLESPNAPELYLNGKLNWGPLMRFNNPHANLQKKYNVSTNNFRSNAVLSYEIIPGLQVKANLGYTQIQTGSYSSTPITSVNPRFGVTTGEAYFGSGDNSTWIMEPQLEYKKNIKDGVLNVLFGTTFQQSVRNSNTLYGTGYTNDQLLDNIQAASSITVMEASGTQYRYTAAFGRLNYTFKQKYIFDLVGRRDGSSRFGPDNRFANFGSVSSAWIFSNENFVRQNLRFLSFGKLRASYGTSGNDQIGDYGYLDTYSTSGVSYQGVVPLSPTRLANPNYSWETNKKFEVGLEAGILEDKLSLSLSYYQNRSSDQLVGLPLSGVTGFNSIQANLPATVENTGIEIEVSSVNLKREEFSWTTSLNMTIPRNKLIEFQNLEGSSYANRFVVGQPINIDKVYAYLGVDPQTGVYQFKDIDGNNAITSPTDNQTIINTSPTLFGGLNNNLRYKNWTLNFLFQYVQQQGASYLASFNMPGLLRNQPGDVVNHWRSPGDISSIQKFSTTTAGNAYPAFQTASRSEKSYEDASFVRLKNISISYQLPKKWMEKIRMQSSEIFVQGQNLLTFTQYNGLDPETRSYINLPPLRTITIGLHFTL